MTTIVALDNIRSAQNVGAIFRTADAAGVGRILLAGYTPAPFDRFGRVQPAIAKTSLGATSAVLWEQVDDDAFIHTLQQLQQEGYQVVAVEQSPGSVSLYEYQRPEDIVYVLGNEIDGVSHGVLELADVILEIPMAGMKESLNVSVTAGVVLFHR